MDLKHKGITWVGNMFQKFEAVCQEVDSIISQDTVKYVENQVGSASDNVKKLYSGVVQGLLPPVRNPVKREAKAAAQTGRVPINARFKTSSLNDGKNANHVVNILSVGHGLTDQQMDNRSQASCEVTFVDEKVAEVSNRSFVELNVDLPLQKNDDVLLDKDLFENMKKTDVNELLSEKSDGSLTEKLAFMESDASDPLLDSLRNASSEINDTNKTASSVYDESDASDPLLNSLRIASSEINDTNKTASLVCDESDASDHLLNSLRNASSETNDTNKTASSVCDDSVMQLEDDVLFVGNNDVVLTDNDASKSSEEDPTMEFNSNNSLKHMVNDTSCQAKITSKEAIQILDNSHLPLESSRVSRKTDNDLSNEKSDEFSKNVVIMQPNATDNLNNNHLSHVWSEANFLTEEADDFNSRLIVELLTGRTDHVLIDKDFNDSPLKDAIVEDNPSSNLLNLPSHENGVSFTYEEANMVSESDHLQLEPELHARMNEDALTDKYSNESLKVDTLLELEHDASYPLKNQPNCTSSFINYKDKEVSSESNDYYLKLESKVYYGKNSEALMDKASDASCKEHANFELSTELISQCDEESVECTLASCDNEREGDILNSTEGSLVTSIHGADVESTHNLRQASSILASSLVNISEKMETASKNLENGTGSSNAPDATSELVSLVLTSTETVEEMRPVSSLKSVPKSFFSASKSLVKNFSSCTVVHEKRADQRASIEYEPRPCFEAVTSASNENRALKMKSVSFSSSLSSMESVAGAYASRANESAFLPKLRTSSQFAFSEPISSGAISLSTEIGRSHNSRCNILDAEMETVDLGHQVTRKAECDIVDYKALHAVSRRTQKLRSYRKRIQDAFNSKKRLAKEYEQLGIWYGEIDLELSTDSSQKLDTMNASTSYASDSEWELL